MPKIDIATWVAIAALAGSLAVSWGANSERLDSGEEASKRQEAHLDATDTRLAAHDTQLATILEQNKDIIRRLERIEAKIDNAQAIR